MRKPFILIIFILPLLILDCGQNHDKGPTVDSLAVTLNEDTSVTVTLTASDPDNDHLTWFIVEHSYHGSITGALPQITYTPDPDYHGSDYCTFKVSDGYLESNIATLDIVIYPVNDPPTETGASIATHEDTVSAGVTPWVMDADPEDSHTYFILTQPANGTALVATDRLVYDPGPNFNGSDSFTFRSSDSDGEHVDGTATVTVIPVNDPPTSTTANIITRENTTSAGVTPTVNDIDSGDTFTFSLLTQPLSGTAFIQSNQLFYQPNLNFTGSDSFTYRAFDLGSESVDGIATVIIFGTNTAPIAYSQSVKTYENTDTLIVLTGSDMEGDELTYSIVSAPSNGALTGTPPNVIYRSDPDYIGSDSFTFKTNDGALDSIPATVQITVDPILDIWFVDIDAAGNADGRSWTNAFHHPQNALDAAGVGDLVWVAEGVYGPLAADGFVITMVEGIQLYGGFAGTETSLPERDFNTYRTVLDGEDTVTVVSGAINARLDGFIITRGRLSGMVNTGVSPTVDNCVFENNGLVEGQDGGAVQNVRNASALIMNTTFINNYRSAIYNADSSPTIDNCIFLDNLSDSGGAIKNTGLTTQPYIGFSIFDNNTASANGGAISNDVSNPLIENCIFTGNTAGGNGGAISNENGAVPVLINSLFSNNTATQLGGAIFNLESEPALLNCTISHNYAESYGGGIVSQNGKGIEVNIINSILWYNSDIQIYEVSEGKTKVTYSNLQEKLKGKGNINKDPLFMDTTVSNYRLSTASPCIDAGNNASITVPNDLDGNPRIIDGNGDDKMTVDMGAYEYVP